MGDANFFVTQFVELIKSTAWPLVVLISLLFLRKPLASFLEAVAVDV